MSHNTGGHKPDLAESVSSFSPGGRITGKVFPCCMMINTVKKIVIEGMTKSGRKFRPSDWAERMSGALSTFGRDQRIRYSPLLQPMTVNGVKCISINPMLQEQYPEMYAYIMEWVNANSLNVYEMDDEEQQAVNS